jgi:cation:H+ antiporter
MHNLLNLLLLLVSIGFLWGGAVWIVEGASRVAARLGLSELMIGLTVVAFGTSSPEFAVTVGAALQGRSDISVGNVVGSNIFNLGFILGCVALMRPLTTSRTIVRRDGVILIGVTLLLVIFLHDRTLKWYEGLVLFCGLFGYLGWLLAHRELPEEEVPTGPFSWFDVVKLILGIGAVVGGGQLLVMSAVALARALNLSEWVIAVTIVGAGTSAPELATSMVAVTKGRHGLSAGNLVGSDLFNMLGVLGLAGILRTLTISSMAWWSLVVMFATVVVVVVFMWTGRRVTRGEGLVLIAISVARWAFDLTR